MILKRDHGCSLSESTVERILKQLMTKGLHPKIPLSLQIRKKDDGSKACSALTVWNQATRPGQMVQMDHMTVSKNNICAKEFRAWDPKSKFIYGELYTNATSRSAKPLFREFIQQAPFKIESIQVDGGAEFMNRV